MELLLHLQLRAEHQAVVKQRGTITLDLPALKAMPYTEAAINEALRLGQVCGVRCSAVQHPGQSVSLIG